MAHGLRPACTRLPCRNHLRFKEFANQLGVSRAAAHGNRKDGKPGDCDGIERPDCAFNQVWTKLGRLSVDLGKDRSWTRPHLA